MEQGENVVTGNSLPQQSESPVFSDCARQRYIESFRKAGYQDFSTNRLTDTDSQQLNSQIDQLISAGDQRTELLVELREFLNRNQAVFPELSHGTSSDAVVGIMQHGLQPRARALQLQDIETQHLGEGARGNFARMFASAAATEVYMGIGQGGLGTTIAYAEMVDDPAWNLNLLSQAEIIELQKKYGEILTNVGHRDREAKQILEDRLTALGKALVRHQRGITPDFPVVLGITRGSGVESPSDPAFRFLCDIRRGGIFLQRKDGFDSEVAVTIDPSEDASSIRVLATTNQNRGRMETTLRGAGRDDIQIVSVEALKLLGELGCPRITEGYDQSKRILNHILDKNERYVKRAVDEFEKGVPPFDYSSLEEP